MPISPATLQRRFAELGRIRLGAKKDGKGRPMKLAAFRFTSPNERYITDLAALYGGTAQPWDNNGKPEYEVFTDATSVPVIAMKGGLSQWMETWSGGGCVHRCDGEVNALTGDRCDDGDRAHRDAKPTTRLSLMLPELDAIGAWRMESHGWNAAAELPNVVELAQFVGDLVPAHLTMVERRSVKDGQTSRYVVPVLDLQIGAARLREVVAAKSGTAELDAPATSSTAAIEAPKTEPAAAAAEVKIPTPAQISAMDADTLRKTVAYLEGRGAGEHPATAAARARLVAVDEPDGEGVVDGEVVEDQAPAAVPGAEGDPEAVWAACLKAGGEQGMSLADVDDGYSIFAGGLLSSEASAAELQAYLDHLIAQSAEQVPA